MNNIDLYPHQIDALKRMKNGCILCCPVGGGKSRTSIAYYYFKVLCGRMKVNGEGVVRKPVNNIPLYIITTAKKRDTKEWDDELKPFGVKAVIDSWNNIKKYAAINNAFFIFDEQRVVGSGTWVKSFLKITKHNQWILLSATPGDTWSDYIPVFVANHFYKNRTEFNHLHTVYKPYLKFPVVDHYINTKVLNRYRDAILVVVDYAKKATKVKHKVSVEYDKELYRKVSRDRWDPYDNEPIAEAGKFCYLQRRVVNSDASRVEAVRKLLLENPKSIIFYNFTYELNILRELVKGLGYEIGEWNGELHTPVPKGKKWVYLAQYTAASEGWNCITTNVTIFYSQSYSYRTTVQAAGRIDRLNTPFSELHYYYIRSSAPIDLAIARALTQKKNFNIRAYVGGMEGFEKE